MFDLMAAVNVCPASGLLCGEPFESAEYYEDEDILFKSNRKVQTERKGKWGQIFILEFATLAANF